jgi:hypothetical protein
MTLEEKLYVELTAVCPRVFTDFAPTDTVRPYVTYQQVGGETLQFMDRTVPSKENADIQVSVWADTRKEAKAMILAIEAQLINATSVQAGPIAASISDFDADMERYCSRQDFNVWADR